MLSCNVIAHGTAAALERSNCGRLLREPKVRSVAQALIWQKSRGYLFNRQVDPNFPREQEFEGLAQCDYTYAAIISIAKSRAGKYIS